MPGIPLELVCGLTASPRPPKNTVENIVYFVHFLYFTRFFAQCQIFQAFFSKNFRFGSFFLKNKGRIPSYWEIEPEKGHTAEASPWRTSIQTICGQEIFLSFAKMGKYGFV